MRYHDGRACAAAGYAGLYDELDLLPDVSIAEEAGESSVDGSERIFGKIMEAPVRFAVIDDYTRSVNTVDPKVAFLNADTVIREHLMGRVLPFADEIYYLELPSTPADIEEDGRFGLESRSCFFNVPYRRLCPLCQQILHQPEDPVYWANISNTKRLYMKLGIFRAS